MSAEILFVFGLLGAVVVLFAGEWLRADLVALLAVLALMVSEVLTPAEALAGFSNDLVLMIAGLFVVGAALEHVGVAAAMGAWLSRVGRQSELRLLIAMMLVVALLSAFLSSTGTVAIFLPVVISTALAAGTSPSRLLLSLAYASLIGGMLTLIGTPPNLAVNTVLREAGLAPFGFFSFTPTGVAALIVGVAYMALVGQRLLPARESPGARTSGRLLRPLATLAASYALPGSIHRLQAAVDSPLLGQTLAEARLRERYNVTMLQAQSLPNGARVPQQARLVTGQTTISAGDLFVVQGNGNAVKRLAEAERLRLLPPISGDELELAPELELVELLVPPYSRLIGQTLADVQLRERFGVTVLGVRRLGEPLDGALARMPLAFGDTLLVGGSQQGIAGLLLRPADLVLVSRSELPTGQVGLGQRAVLALLILLAMLLLMTFEIVPNVTAVLSAALALVLTGCLPITDVYQRISWESVVLIAGMVPLASALQKTGGLSLLADAMVGLLGGYGPLVMMAGLFLLTSVFSQFISNTATALLVAPIGVQVAGLLDVSPYPLLMAIAIAASAAFATPVASPVNTLVLDAGGYRFVDYVRVGVPLQFLILAVTLLVVPLLFPFR